MTRSVNCHFPSNPSYLRVLESGKFRRVGGTVSLGSKVRIISATNRNLAEMVKEGISGRFIFTGYRFFLLKFQPLRDRRQDLPELVDYLLQAIKRKE